MGTEITIHAWVVLTTNGEVNPFPCRYTWPHNFFFVWPYLPRPPSQVVEFFSDIVTTDLSGLFVELGYFILLLALSTARI